MGLEAPNVRNTARMKIPTTLVSSFAVVLFVVGCGGGVPANMPEAPAVPSGVPAAMPAVPEVPSGVPAVPAAPAAPSGVPAAPKK
jgi:hypothetical protein